MNELEIKIKELEQRVKKLEAAPKTKPKRRRCIPCGKGNDIPRCMGSAARGWEYCTCRHDDPEQSNKN